MFGAGSDPRIVAFRELLEAVEKPDVPALCSAIMELRQRGFAVILNGEGPSTAPPGLRSARGEDRRLSAFLDLIEAIDGGDHDVEDELLGLLWFWGITIKFTGGASCP